MADLQTHIPAALRRFREFNAANVEFWERYLRHQRPLGAWVAAAPGQWACHPVLFVLGMDPEAAARRTPS